VLLRKEKTFSDRLQSELITYYASSKNTILLETAAKLYNKGRVAQPYEMTRIRTRCHWHHHTMWNVVI